jgi:hypothetical protein
LFCLLLLQNLPLSRFEIVHKQWFCGMSAQNVDVEKCQNGNQLPLLMIFRFLKQRFDQWTEELAANGQKIPSYDAVAVRWHPHRSPSPFPMEYDSEIF